MIVATFGKGGLDSGGLVSGVWACDEDLKKAGYHACTSNSECMDKSEIFISETIQSDSRCSFDGRAVVVRVFRNSRTYMAIHFHPFHLKQIRN
jgi:hypothetical protein